LRELADRLWRKPRRIIFTDGKDLRILRVARHLAETGLAKPAVVGSPFEIREFADQNKIRTRGISIKKPLHDVNFDRYCRFFRKNFDREASYSAVREKLQKPLWYAAQLILHGQADLCFAPATTEASELLEIERIFSSEEPFLSAFSLVRDDKKNRIMLFADTKFNPRPDSEELAKIARLTALNFETLTGRRAAAALLSFSTKGSANHPMVDVIREALKQIRAQEPHLKVEGELQFDAAFVPEVGAKKAPDNALGGAANVFVFPSLSAADIAIKMVRHLSPFRVEGPFLQGLKFPVQFICPDADDDQIINQALIASNLVNA